MNQDREARSKTVVKAFPQLNVQSFSVIFILGIQQYDQVSKQKRPIFKRPAQADKDATLRSICHFVPDFAACRSPQVMRRGVYSFENACSHLFQTLAVWQACCNITRNFVLFITQQYVSPGLNVIKHLYYFT